MQEVSGSIPLGSTIIEEFEYLSGKLVGEVSPTGFFRVSRFVTACSTVFQTG
ncbi:MAG: hypothetical protein RL671_668 [Pseudomonadota bacterium]